jgi:flagellin
VFATGQTAVKTVVDKLQVASLNPGANYNNMQVRFEGKIGLVTPIASYDAVKNEMVIQVDTASTVNSSFAKIVTAINGVTAGGVAGGFSANWITPTNGLNYIYGSKVDVNAVGNTASSGGNTLLADLVIEVAGATGSEAFNFGAGTSVNQIANAVNLVSDSTGVWAAQDNGLLSLKSNGYGSKYFTAATITNEGIAGTLKTAMSASRATGTDADAKINGITAVADGNLLSVITSTLDMSIEVTAGKVTAFNFSITGGGALFQLGPDVVANQQARMGIQSVNTTRLGGASGKLYQLGNGQDASLKNNVGLAAKIADDAVTSIINIRGRLGAFQKTTLDTNIKALNDTVVALTEAESSIRDADFATETANLSRAQILSQSGMAVLAIANRQPQDVLALLRNL